MTIGWDVSRPAGPLLRSGALIGFVCTSIMDCGGSGPKGTIISGISGVKIDLFDMSKGIR